MSANADIIAVVVQFVLRAVRAGLLQIVTSAVPVRKKDNLLFFGDVFNGRILIHDPVSGEVLPILAVSHISNLIGCHSGVAYNGFYTPVMYFFILSKKSVFSHVVCQYCVLFKGGPPETQNISIESNNLMVIRNNFPFVGHPKSFATVQTGKVVTNNWV